MKPIENCNVIDENDDEDDNGIPEKTKTNNPICKSQPPVTSNLCCKLLYLIFHYFVKLKILINTTHLILIMPESNNEDDISDFILTSIQKVNPSIKSILKYYNMCCLYDFNIENKKWNKLGMEGPCFLYESNGGGIECNMMVLAQKSMKKLDICIDSEWKLEKHEDKCMLIFKASDKQIRSIHFANTEQINDCYNTLAATISRQSKRST